MKNVSTSMKLSLLKTDSARLLYSWLIPHVDYNGCYSGDAEVVRGKIFTRLKKTAVEVEVWLAELEDKKLIIRYEANGDKFLQVVGFIEKQPHLNPDREACSPIPLPPGKKAPKKPAKPKPEKGVDPGDIELAKLLSAEIKKNNPMYSEKPEQVNSWADDIRLMREQDKRGPADIRKVMLWCQADSFWKENILSGANLRKHFIQLWGKMNSGGKEKTPAELEEEDERALKDPGR